MQIDNSEIQQALADITDAENFSPEALARLNLPWLFGAYQLILLVRGSPEYTGLAPHVVDLINRHTDFLREEILRKIPAEFHPEKK